MTEIQTSVLPAADPSDTAIDHLLKQAQAMQAAHQIGTALANTSMVPDHFRGKPDDAAAAILYGSEVGMSATTALQNIFVVRGKPAMYAKTMVALVISAGHEVAPIEESSTSVVWAGRRSDTGQEYTSTWTVDRARVAGFLSNKLYESMPVEMLRAKAQTEVCRVLFPDVLLGMAYSREELELEQGESLAPSAPVRRRGGRGLAGLREKLDPTPAVEQAAPPAAAVEPTVVDVEPEPAPAPKKPTKAQLNKLANLLVERVSSDQQECLAWLSTTLGREQLIEATSELSADDLAVALAEVDKLPVPEAQP